MTAIDPRPPTITDRLKEHTDDMEAIRAIIADIETGLNTNDVGLMTAHFAENATVVGANGVTHRGRTAIHDAHVLGLAGFLRDEYVRYEVDEVVFVRSDVACARKYAHAMDADGALLATEPSMTALYVLCKQGDRWWIVARQNTLIPAVTSD